MNENKNISHILPTIEQREKEEIVPNELEIGLKYSTLEKAVTNLYSEVANLTSLREAIEHSFSVQQEADNIFKNEIITYFNSLEKKFEKFSESLEKEIDYKSELEEKIKNADLSRQVYLLQKELNEERSKISLFIESLENSTLKSLQSLDDKCKELKSADSMIKDSIMKFRNDTFSASENEYKALKINVEAMLKSFMEKVQETLEAVKKQSINFLQQCEKENKEVIKKIPAVKAKMGKSDWIVLAMGALGILSFFGNLLLR